MTSVQADHIPRPDGTIDDETAYLLQALAGWFAICGEAIHGTRPWRQFGEGDGRVTIEGFREEQVAWNSADYRFTRKGKTLFAFMLKAPENRIAVIKSLTEAEKVAAVKLLGAGDCAFNQAFGVLTIKLPETLPTAYTNVLALDLASDVRD